MSLRTQERIWEHATQKNGALAVLLALGWFADDDGIAWPSVPTLADRVNLSERQVLTILHQLDADGAILYQPGNGRGHTSSYMVVIGLDAPKLAEIATRRAKDELFSPFAERVKFLAERVKFLAERVKSSTQKGEVFAGKGEVFDTERVKFLHEKKAPAEASKRAETAQSSGGIRHGDPSEIRQGSGGRKQRAAPAAPTAPPHPPQSAPRDARSPAEQAYQDAYPKAKLSEQQRQAISSTVTDLEHWRRILKLWIENGWKPSVGNLLDRYRKEPTDEQQRQGPSAHQPRRLAGGPQADSGGRRERIPAGLRLAKARGDAA